VYEVLAVMGIWTGLSFVLGLVVGPALARADRTARSQRYAARSVAYAAWPSMP
jgi:hypothetical protein